MSVQTLLPTLASRDKRWLLLIVLLVVVLGSVNNVISPLFEPPDERLHYQFVRDLLDQRRLPVQLATAPPSQSHQPPLYYLGGALLVAAVPDSQILPEPNPFWSAIRLAEVSRDNKRQFLPHPAYQFPYQDTALVVHLLRLWSTLLAAATVVMAWAIARVLWPRSPFRRMAMTVLVAFNPMFLYLAGAVNNDNLIALLGSLLTLLVLIGLRDGFTPRRSLLVGLVWGLALLTKLNGLVLAAVWGMALVWAAWRQRSTRFLITHTLLIVTMAALVAGWWFVRNLHIYGDPLAFNILLTVWGERSREAAALGMLWRDVRYGFTTFWGRFGYGQIPLPAPLYLAVGLLCGAALVGGLRALWARRRPRSVWLVLVVAVAAYVAAFAYFLLRNPTGANGRYVYPVLPAIAALLVAGLTGWGPRLGRVLQGGAAFLMAALAAFTAVFYLPWVYAPPPIFSSVADLTIENALDSRYPELATLLGYDLAPQTAVPGANLDVTLYWHVEEATDQNYVVFVQLVTADGRRVAGRDTHPGLGLYPTNLWQPGEIVVDTIPLTVDADAGAGGPTGLQVLMGLHTGQDVRLETAAGNDTIDAGWVRLAAASQPQPVGRPVDYQVGELVALIAVEAPAETAVAGAVLPFTLTWRTRQNPTRDYVVFVHLVNAEGELIDAFDGPPVGGAYPTHLWQPDDVVIDPRRLTLPTDLPPGTYQVLAGWYRLEDLTRLPIAAAGAPLPDAAIPIFTITVK